MRITTLPLLAAVSALAVSASGTAEAGGFAVREQSASLQGSSFAGSAAGSDLSSMFWNPAAVANKQGINSESHAAIILGQSDLTATGGALNVLPEPPFSSTSGNIADPAVVSSAYGNYQFGNFYIGYSLTAPYGLTTKPENFWKGQSLGNTSKLLTVNAAPTVGYQIMPGVTVAAGVQIQYIKARLTSVLAGTPQAALGSVDVEGDDFGYGYSAGIMFEPSSSTKIGLGFRSKIDHELEGDQASAFGISNIVASVELPETVTLSARQKVTDRLAFLGTVEWTNWSRVKQIDINCASAGGACVAPGQTLSSLELNYDDGWFFSAGLEYDYAPNLILRGGLAYEISPARNDSSRTVRIADNDRIWASIGATYAWNASTSLDLAYTHIFVEDGGIVQGQAGPGLPLLTADVEQSVDIIADSIKIKWGGAPTPLK